MKRTKVCSLCLILILMGSSVVWATESRVESLGGVGYYIRDNTNIFIFPGTMMQYRNQAVAELRSKGNDQSYTVGAQFPKSETSVVGLYLNRPLSISPSYIISNVAPKMTLDRCITLMYGGKNGDMSYGLLLSFAMDKFSGVNDWGDEIKQSARYIGISAGVSKSNFDLGLHLEMPAANYEEEGSDDDTWSGTVIGLTGRMFSQQSEKLELVGLGNLCLGFSGREVGSTDVNYNQLKIQIGGAANYQLDKNNMAVLAVEAFGLDQEKTVVKDGDEVTNKITTLPGIYLGIESQVKPWLIARLGARQLYQTATTVTDPENGEDTEESAYGSSFNVSFGLGITAGHLELDAVFNEGLLFDGPNFITGQSNALAYRMSVTYHFDMPK